MKDDELAMHVSVAGRSSWICAKITFHDEHVKWKDYTVHTNTETLATHRWTAQAQSFDIPPLLPAKHPRLW